MKETGPEKNREQELAIALEEERSLSRARMRLLEENIRELNEVYDALRLKLNDIRQRDRRIKDFEEELIRANRLSDLGELAGSIAHEIKNPLISIQGFAKRIEKSRKKDKVEEYAKLIDKEAERLSTVLVKLLEFSRMGEPKGERLDLNDMLNDTVLFMEHHLTRFKNVELIVEKTPDLPPVKVEKIHIQQAIVNMMINAAQAMQGGGKILLRTGREGDWVYLSVTDTGTGIKEELLEKIFQPFFTTKERGEGTGLGLSLSKRLVEANQGIIEVRSKLGEGTTFRLLFPALAD
jgi:signal transduction histidine kinase